MAEPPSTNELPTPRSIATRIKSIFRRKPTSSSPSMWSQPAPWSTLQGRPQPQSSFLNKLPPEIRRAIYTHVFGHSLIHIVDIGRRLAHVRCPRPQPQKVWDGHRHGIEGLEGCPILNEEEHPNDALLALCMTCKIVYVGSFSDYASVIDNFADTTSATTKPSVSSTPNPRSQYGSRNFSSKSAPSPSSFRMSALCN